MCVCARALTCWGRCVSLWSDRLRVCGLCKVHYGRPPPLRLPRSALCCACWSCTTGRSCTEEEREKLLTSVCDLICFISLFLALFFRCRLSKILGFRNGSLSAHDLECELIWPHSTWMLNWNLNWNDRERYCNCSYIKETKQKRNFISPKQQILQRRFVGVLFNYHFSILYYIILDYTKIYRWHLNIDY